MGSTVRLRSTWILISVLALGAGTTDSADAQVVALALSGSCYDEITLLLAGASKNGEVELYQSASAGMDAVPGGQCAGTALGLDDPQLLLGLAADGSGSLSAVLTPPIEACGRLVQIVDLSTCAASNVEVLFRAPASVPKTGVRWNLGDRDDPELKRGVPWPEPRFTDNLDGTVTDNLTGLIWLEDASCSGVAQAWDEAAEVLATLADGQCGLPDGSSPGDWRLPNILELDSLIDFGVGSPIVGHPFDGIELGFYWSSTASAADADEAWIFEVTLVNDAHSFPVSRMASEGWAWPVRGGEGWSRRVPAIAVGDVR